VPSEELAVLFARTIITSRFAGAGWLYLGSEEAH
jgi:hypothetical protein